VKPTKLGKLFSQVNVAIFRLSGALGREGDRLSKPLGMTHARWKLLASVVHSHPAKTVSQIARITGQSRQAIQRLVDSMVKEELLQLTENPHHQRAKLVETTPDSASLYQQLQQIQTPWAEALATSFSEEELETTLRVIHRISEKIER